MFSLKKVAPILALLVALGGFYLLQISKPVPEESGEAQRPTSLFVEPVSQRPVQLSIYTEGEVTARTEIDLVSQVAGRIVSASESFVDGGQFLTDEVLIQVESIDYEIAYINAQAEVARRRTILLQAEADADVARQQLAGISTSELGLKKPQISEAKAGLYAAEANLKQAKTNLDRTKISLPFDGRIRDRYVDFGQYVTPGTPIARVFSTDFAEVRLPLTDSQLAFLGLPIGFEASAESAPEVDLLATVAGAERHWVGRLVRIDSAFDSTTRLLYATVQIEDPYAVNSDAAESMPLALGLYVSAEIKGRQLADALVVPRAALRSGDTLFVVEDGLLDIRQVTVEQSSHDRVVLSGGVTEGELVVVSPVRDPVRGMRVEAINAVAELDTKNLNQLDGDS